tara:strand:- start:726 stop:1739 length:1014 start_codon:yes stop_codon:yes gene_type:complete
MNLIVADVGGTNARLAFQKNINSEICLIENFLCTNFKSLEDIITAYKKKHNIISENMSIGVAGPCEDNDVVLSNNHIKFNKIELLKCFKLKSLLVINDFVSQSFTFKDLLLEQNKEKSEILFNKLNLKKIKNGTSRKISTLLVTGPGTGLGVCTLKKIGNHVIPIPGEGGNACFSPNNSEQIEILTHFLKSHKYVSFEDLVSGRGIKNLFDFYQNKNRSQKLNIKAREIAELANEKDPNAISAITQMYKIFATSILNGIFLNGFRAGVVICGGISIKLQNFLNQNIFIDEFLKIDQYFDYLNDIPIYLSKNESNGLIGAKECFHDSYFKKTYMIYNK